MEQFKIYLDNCCFNRPFDDQSQVRIRIETEAKLYVQQQIEEGNLLLVWSYILDFENAANPYDIRKRSIKQWKNKAVEFVSETDNILRIAENIASLNIKAKDALHIACAIECNCNYFITTDDEIIKKSATMDQMVVCNPVDILKILDE